MAVHGRARERADRVAGEITAAGGKAVVALGDLTHDDDMEQLAGTVERLLGGVDILVNNAGGSSEKQVWEKIPAAGWAATRPQYPGSGADRKPSAAQHASRQMGPGGERIERGWPDAASHQP